jgi:hypothetical protein
LTIGEKAARDMQMHIDRRVCAYLYLSIHPSIHPSIYPSIYIFIYIYIYIYLSIYLSIFIHISNVCVWGGDAGGEEGERERERGREGMEKAESDALALQGYPLFTMLSWLGTVLIPFGSPG